LGAPCRLAAQEPATTSRREVLSAVSIVSLLAASPAQAFLGFGDDSSLQDTYSTRTVRGVAAAYDLALHTCIVLLHDDSAICSCGAVWAGCRHVATGLQARPCGCWPAACISAMRMG
jgi:hypothetical protein